MRDFGRAVTLRPAAAFLLALALSAASPGELHACTCVMGAPICETFWRTPVVFSGEVLQVSTVPGAKGFLASRVVTFRVDRIWRGSAGDTVEIFTGSGGGDCGSQFSVGVQYLVYASHFQGRLSTNICTRTKPLAEAQEDIDYITGAFEAAASGRIFGAVRYRADTPGGAAHPVAGYVVVASDGQREWSTETSADGRYEFTGLPAGTYSVRVEVPETEHAHGPAEVQLADTRGCAAAEFYVAANGRIATRLLDEAGQPLSGVNVEIVEFEPLLQKQRYPVARFAATGADGAAEVAQLPPGRYVVGINVVQVPDATHPYTPVFYPGAAELAGALVIDLAPGERVDVGPFMVPRPLERRAITGVVVWPDGTPAAGALVRLHATAHAVGRLVGPSAHTDAAGRFSLPAFAGQRYRVSASRSAAEGEPPWNASSGDFELTPDTLSLTLTLGPPRR